MSTEVQSPPYRQRSLSSLRWKTGGLLLCLTIVAPVLATLDRSASHYRLVTLLALAFSGLLLPEAIREARTMTRSPVIRAVLWATVMLVLGWILLSGPMWRSERALFYLSLPCFYAATVAWLRPAPERRFRLAFIAKLLITGIAAAWIAAAGYIDAEAGMAGRIMTAPPLYLHFRHVNPDIFYVVALAPCFWAGSRRLRWLIAAMLLPLGYFSVWCGARAEFIAFAILAGLLLSFRIIRRADARIFQPALFFALGGALVFALGQTQFLGSMLGRTVTASVDLATSGRWAIWKQCLNRLSTDSTTLLFGYGPDAYRRIGISGDMTRITGFVNPTSHPHDTAVLWLLEFGLVGAIPLLILVGAVLYRSLSNLRSGRGLILETGIAATLIASFAFSLVDCHFYYAAPLLFFLVMAAFQRAAAAAR